MMAAALMRPVGDGYGNGSGYGSGYGYGYGSGYGSGTSSPHRLRRPCPKTTRS